MSAEHVETLRGLLAEYDTRFFSHERAALESAIAALQRQPADADRVDAPGSTEWNGRDTLPKDGTRIRILWSNGKEDVGYFMPLDYASPWIDVTRREHPEIYEHGGEWNTEFGEWDNSEFHPIGWLPLDAAIDSARAEGGGS